jgi:hypothetical protein
MSAHKLFCLSIMTVTLASGAPSDARADTARSAVVLMVDGGGKPLATPADILALAASVTGASPAPRRLPVAENLTTLAAIIEMIEWQKPPTNDLESRIEEIAAQIKKLDLLADKIKEVRAKLEANARPASNVKPRIVYTGETKPAGAKISTNNDPWAIVVVGNRKPSSHDKNLTFIITKVGQIVAVVVAAETFGAGGGLVAAAIIGSAAIIGGAAAAVPDNASGGAFVDLMRLARLHLADSSVEKTRGPVVLVKPKPKKKKQLPVLQTARPPKPNLSDAGILGTHTSPAGASGPAASGQSSGAGRVGR